MKKMELCEVRAQREISQGIFDLRIAAPAAAGDAVPGQFVNLYTDDSAKLLPRPVSICRIDRASGELRLVYRVSGAKTGTGQFAAMKPGAKVRLLGPLGNGFPLGEVKGSVFLIGGGIGIPPMLETAKALAAAGKHPEMILGYRDDCFLAEEFAQYGPVYIATEQGNAGIKGTVLDVILQERLHPRLIFACGPRPMLRALSAYADAREVTCFVSMEERMACGVGACLACVCETAREDGHSYVRNARVCRDGPVFRTTDIVL